MQPHFPSQECMCSNYRNNTMSPVSTLTIRKVKKEKFKTVILGLPVIQAFITIVNTNSKLSLIYMYLYFFGNLWFQWALLY